VLPCTFASFQKKSRIYRIVDGAEFSESVTEQNSQNSGQSRMFRIETVPDSSGMKEDEIR